MTPIMHARGKWELLAPWTADLVADASYVCIAIDSFQKVLAEGINIFEAYYKPKGLSQEKYDTDRVNATSLVTLHSDDHGEIVVPTTYIKSAPTSVSSGFSRLVMGLDVGVLPDSIDLSYTTAEIKALFSALTGLTDVEVTMYTAPITGTMTPEQAASFEANRLAAIEKRATFYATNEKLQARVAELEAVKLRYEQIIIAAGLKG